jgi:hypothetical protein
MTWRISTNRSAPAASRRAAHVTSGVFHAAQNRRVSITVTGVSPDARPVVSITPPARAPRPKLHIEQGTPANSVTVSFLPAEGVEPLYGFAVSDLAGNAEAGYEIEFAQAE